MEDNKLSIASQIMRLKPGESVSFPISKMNTVRTRLGEIRKIFDGKRKLRQDTTTNSKVITIIRIK